MRQFRLPWLLSLCLLPLAAPATAPVRIDAVDFGSAATGIRGIWPDACPPQVRTWSGDAHGIDVLIASAAGPCAPVPQAFSLSVPTGDSFSPALPEQVVRPLRVFAAHGEQPPMLVGFRLSGGTDIPSHPDAGFWWPAVDGSSGGNVVSLEVQGDRLGMALLSHDAQGAPEWYFGTAQLTGSVAHVELARMQGGSSPFAAQALQPQPQPALAVDLAFQSSTHAHMWLSRREAEGTLELVSTDIDRRSFDSLPQRQTWLGSWLVADAASSADTETLPATLNFGSSVVTARGSLRYTDGGNGYTLDCQPGGDADAPAQYCALEDAGGRMLVRFDRVDFDRLDGSDAAGNAVVLLRPR